MALWEARGHEQAAQGHAHSQSLRKWQGPSSEGSPATTRQSLWLHIQGLWSCGPGAWTPCRLMEKGH